MLCNVFTNSGDHDSDLMGLMETISIQYGVTPRILETLAKKYHADNSIPFTNVAKQIHFGDDNCTEILDKYELTLLSTAKPVAIIELEDGELVIALISITDITYYT